MSLDGLRAWIGEVERKLGVRTKVMLALAVIAIGGAGAAIYLAIDTRDNAVSEKDVQELQETLEAQIGASGTAGSTTDSAQLESELRALQAEVEALKNEGGSGKGKGTGSDGASTVPGGASAGNAAELSEKLRELGGAADKETK